MKRQYLVNSLFWQNDDLKIEYVGNLAQVLTVKLQNHFVYYEILLAKILTNQSYDGLAAK